MRLVQFALIALLVVLLSAFGCGSGGKAGGPGVTVPTFDATRAFADLQAQVDFGPRNPGTTAHENCRTWIRQRFQAASSDVTEQTFNFRGADGSNYPSTNLIAVFPGSRQAGGVNLLVGAHWDCRPVADRDPTPANRSTPIPGANDGASGVAVLTELGRAFQATPPPVTIALVALDLEDSGNTAITTGQPNQGFSIGTQHFVDNIGRWRPNEGIIVDMVGDRNLKLLREPNSVASDGALVNAVWSAGQSLGFSQFNNGNMVSLIDDHIPFIQAGIKCIDIIDFDYPGPNDSRFWHTLDDVPANCDGTSLRAVGQTLLEVVYNR